MKNSILILCLFFFSCGDNLIEEVTERYDNGGLKYVNYYKKVNDNKELVRWVSYFKNGQVNVEQNFKGDKLHGNWTHYDKNGKITWEENYIDGKLIK